MDKNMGKTWKNQTSCQKREELCMSFGSDSTQYVAPSPRCDLSMSQRRLGGFALQNAKSKITTTWSSRTRRVMATDAVRETSSNRFTQPLVRHYIPIRWDGKQYVKVAHLNTVSQWFSMYLRGWLDNVLPNGRDVYLFFLYFLELN